MNLNFIIISIFMFCFLTISIIVYKVYKHHNLVTYIKSFPEYATVLNYYMEKAYDIIHKDRILIYSLEATKLPDKEFNSISYDFVNLVIKFIGPRLYKEYKDIYGSSDCFIFNIIEYFNTRYEEDEIRKESLNTLATNNKEETSNV